MALRQKSRKFKIPSLRKFRHCEALKKEGAISFKIPSKIPKPCVIPRLDRGISFKIPSLRVIILNSSGVLGAAAPKGLGRSPYKICELG